MRTVSSIPLLLLLLATPAAAQDELGKPRQSGFVLEAGEYDLADLVQRAGRYLRRNILLDEAELDFGNASQRNSSRVRNQQQQQPARPVVTLDIRMEVDAVGCEELLCALLYSQGFHLLPLDEQKGLYQVVGMSGPNASKVFLHPLAMSSDDVLRRSNLKMMVSTSLTLQHIPAAEARQFLATQFQNRGSYLQFGILGDTLSMQGFADQVATAIRALRDADHPRPPDKEADERFRELQERIQRLEAELATLKSKSDKESQSQ